MKIIEKLSRMIKEEVHDAEKYADCALKYKEERPALARLFYQLSDEELDHQKRLHDHVVMVVQEYKDAGNSVPVAMQAVYDYLHGQIIEETAEVKRLQAIFRES